MDLTVELSDLSMVLSADVDLGGTSGVCGIGWIEEECEDSEL
jgi:hypothetical protein